MKIGHYPLMRIHSFYRVNSLLLFVVFQIFLNLLLMHQRMVFNILESVFALRRHFSDWSSSWFSCRRSIRSKVMTWSSPTLLIMSIIHIVCRLTWVVLFSQEKWRLFINICCIWRLKRWIWVNLQLSLRLDILWMHIFSTLLFAWGEFSSSKTRIFVEVIVWAKRFRLLVFKFVV